MVNAKKELKEIIKKKNLILKCVNINYQKFYDKNIPIILKVNHTKCQQDEFFEKLDFEYDDGFGSEILYGLIWFTDGTWLERHEDDGSEWWEYKITPKIPKNLK